MEFRDLVFHGLVIKRHSGADAVASLMGLATGDVESVLASAEQTGRVVKANDAFTLAPLAKLALEARYSLYYGELRETEAFVQAYERFEVINKSLKALITDWQTVDVGGRRVANNHDDKDYDDDIIDRLGAIHEQMERVFQQLEQYLPRLGVYQKKLLHALESAEDGEIEWVSDIRIESYHTVWFEMHEDLLRIMGQERQE